MGLFKKHKGWVWTVFLWIAVAVFFNLPQYDWRIGVFRSGDYSLLVPSIYGVLVNAIIYFGNIYYLIPKYLSNREFQKYLIIGIGYFTAISIGEALLDCLVYYFTYQSIDTAIVLEIIETVCLLNFLFFLVPSYLHRFAKDWLKSTSVESKSESAPDDLIIIKSGTEVHQIPKGDLLYCESDGNYVKVHTQDKFILVRESLSNMVDLLPVDEFIRCHKSFLVSKAAVTKVRYDALYLGKVQVPIGRKYRPSIKESFQSI